MIPRTVRVALSLALAAAVLAGCTAPAPAPTPSAPFASEEEAFAAAEETYRAYVDALNQVDLSDPETFEAVYAWTTGDANANERQNLSQMSADGWMVSGETIVVKFQSVERANVTGIVARACVDLASVEVLDASGASMVSPDRRDRSAIELVFKSTTSTRTGLAIATSNAVEDSTCG